MKKEMDLVGPDATGETEAACEVDEAVAAVAKAGNISEQHLEALHEALEICIAASWEANQHQACEADRGRPEHRARARRLARHLKQAAELFPTVHPRTRVIAANIFDAQLERLELESTPQTRLGRKWTESLGYTNRCNRNAQLYECLLAAAFASERAVPRLRRGPKETTYPLKEVMLVLHDLWVDDVGRVFSDEFTTEFPAHAHHNRGELTPNNACSRFCLEALRQLVKPAPSVETCRHVMREVKKMRSPSRQPSRDRRRTRLLTDGSGAGSPPNVQGARPVGRHIPSAS